MVIKEKIRELIELSLRRAREDNRLALDEFPAVKIEYPKEDKFGDYATPLALEVGKKLRRPPAQVAGILKEYIEESDIIERAEVAGPGFLNLFLSAEFLFQLLKNILTERDAYGKNRKEFPKKVNVEFVSANPTGPLNIVSARAAAIGDTIANLIEARGDLVDREFYVNDFGNQVHLLGKSVLCRLREAEGRPMDFPGEGYRGEYVRDIAAHVREECGTQMDGFLEEEELINFLAVKAVEYNIAGQKRELERFNVRFARWFSERRLHDQGGVPLALEYLESRGSIYAEEGKKVFRSTDFGDDKDRVVVRDDGRPTYFLADIAYHKDKIDRGYGEIIDIWGPDHHGYIARLRGAVEALGYPPENFSILIAQQVNLIMEGEAVKMSKRLGKFSTMGELIDEIGVDVARYFFIMRSLESHLDFDLALAKKQSSENPVFYLQYAHARICSIFREAEKRGKEYHPGSIVADYLKNTEAVALMKLLIQFPEEIINAADTREPHRVANYLLTLAQAYHKFYTEHRVVSDDASMTNAYLALCDAVRIVIRNGLKMLGVSAPERM